MTMILYNTGYIFMQSVFPAGGYKRLPVFNGKNAMNVNLRIGI